MGWTLTVALLCELSSMTMLLWYVIGYHGYTGMNLISGLEYTKDCVTTICNVSSFLFIFSQFLKSKMAAVLDISLLRGYHLSLLVLNLAFSECLLFLWKRIFVLCHSVMTNLYRICRFEPPPSLLFFHIPSSFNNPWSSHILCVLV